MCYGGEEKEFRILKDLRFKLNKCPVRYIDSETLEILSLYSHYKNGFLADTGGLREQSIRYLMFMDFTSSVVSAFERELMGKN
ncbi:hypothetical protein AB834_00850 [PVC group bacterium (ex Bugula neritina AB1)]|nr:hypothetical protein AB834_00850 [PVC group bacterium (ex Bugula neritina AB1)]